MNTKKSFYISSYSTIITTLLSIYVTYIYITSYISRNNFFYFGMLYLFLLFVLVILYVAMGKAIKSSRVIKYIFIVTVAIDITFFAIYLIHTCKYLYWVIGSSAE